MARFTPLWTGDEETDPTVISALLAERGIHFERWEMPDEAVTLAGRPRLDDASKARLLELFRDHLGTLQDAGAFKDADVVAIRADLPGLDAALARFDKVHFHDDDEIRAIVGGHGVFGFIDDDGKQFLLTVEAGDYINVPAGMWHWFYCLDDRNITALRLFEDTAGWVPHYRSTTRGTPA